ncbi:hypothetical protein [Prochlorococcus marinus]|uniref:hypothetical protein n=1 Tax=Prochlorococcus marinus TaxID=1219 RepID=UPI0039AED20A
MGTLKRDYVWFDSYLIPEEWHPTNEELEVIESAWMQVKIAGEKYKCKQLQIKNIFQICLTK